MADTDAQNAFIEKTLIEVVAPRMMASDEREYMRRAGRPVSDREINLDPRVFMQDMKRKLEALRQDPAISRENLEALEQLTLRPMELRSAISFALGEIHESHAHFLMQRENALFAGSAATDARPQDFLTLPLDAPLTGAHAEVKVARQDKGYGETLTHLFDEYQAFRRETFHKGVAAIMDSARAQPGKSALELPAEADIEMFGSNVTEAVARLREEGNFGNYRFTKGHLRLEEKRDNNPLSVQWVIPDHPSVKESVDDLHATVIDDNMANIRFSKDEIKLLLKLRGMNELNGENRSGSALEDMQKKLVKLKYLISEPGDQMPQAADFIRNDFSLAPLEDKLDLPLPPKKPTPPARHR